MGTARRSPSHRPPGRAGHHRRGLGHLPLALRQRRLAHRAPDDLPGGRRRLPGGAVVQPRSTACRGQPWVAAILNVLGVYVLFRFLGRPRGPGPATPAAVGPAGPLGLGAGFLDAVGGGGWGPVGTPTLLASGRMEPRKVIGSVDTGEFLVALGASLGFPWSRSAGGRCRWAWCCCCWRRPGRGPAGRLAGQAAGPPQAGSDRRRGHPAHQRPAPWPRPSASRAGAPPSAYHPDRGRRPGRLAPSPSPASAAGPWPTWPPASACPSRSAPDLVRAIRTLNPSAVAVVAGPPRPTLSVVYGNEIGVPG